MMQDIHIQQKSQPENILKLEQVITELQKQVATLSKQGNHKRDRVERGFAEHMVVHCSNERNPALIYNKYIIKLVATCFGSPNNSKAI